ncbi:MAG TPA: carboxypeptidase-like regulatory domain-containing protein [Bryobacteraceae bacterium]|jgi:hypothetical protein|nr:carboxypeptidase-like regulatory domain-containing protein [Bryobacteraceae bacterium]
MFQHLSFRAVKIPVFALAIALLALCNRPLRAQSQPISGVVVDTSGSVIPGATVTIKDAAKGDIARQTTTDENGRFQAINIQPGAYTITVEKTGFKSAEENVTLNVNEKLDVGKIALEVGQVNETVSVSDVAPSVETGSMDKAYLVNQIQISQLPMNGRNWIALMSTVPGMTSSAQSDFNVNFNDVSQFHGLGGRGSENNFYLDGSPNVDVGDNQSQYTQPSIDSISEFRVLQSAFNAEYGRAESTAISVQTKSGTAQFHGAAYEYLRNDYFDAKCVLCNTLSPTLRYNQFGGNLGGWLWIPKISTPQDKKLFFFYNREMTRRNLPSSNYADVPDAQILSGDFSPWLTSNKMQYAPAFNVGTVFEPGTITRDGSGNITGGVPFPGNKVPQTMWNQQSAALLNVYTKTIPNYAGLPAAPSPGYARYYYNNPDILHKDQDLARVDYQVSSKFSTFFRWVNDYQKEQIQTGIWTGEPFPIQPQERPKPGSSWSLNFVNTFTPTLASETILAYNKQSQSLSIVGNNPISIQNVGATFPQLYPLSNITNSVPNVTTNAGFGYSLGDPGWHNWGKDYSITENMTKVLSSHTLKFGTFLERDDKAQTATWPQNASIDYTSNAAMVNDTGNGLANLMLGNFNSYTQPNVSVFPYFRFWSAEFYAQDSWKVNRRLTIDYGLRFQHMVPTYTVVRGGTPGGEGTFKLYSVDLTKYNPANAPAIDPKTGYLIGNASQILSQLGLVCDPCAGTPPGFSPAKNFFQPRVGFAYDLTGDGKTAVRAGLGLFNERLRQNNFNFGAGSSWPNQTTATALYGNTGNINVAAITGQNGPIPPPSELVWGKDNTMPTIYSWYFGIQRQLTSSMALDLSYAGNRSVHLMDQRSINALPAGYTLVNPLALPSVGNKPTALYPYRGWGTLTDIETASISRYNALMVRFTRRFAHGLTGNVNYTFSKAMDEADNDSDTINNPFNMRQSYALAGYDQTHVFSTDWVYDLPNARGAFDKPVVRAILNGWELTGIFRIQSGMPITITGNGNLDGYNVGSQYVDLVGDPYAGQNSAQWLNPQAFTRPADGTYGSLGRNSLRLPTINNLDASLLKNFNFTERFKLTYRFEVFNVANHPEIWGINTSFSGDNPGSHISATNNTFGEVNAWRDPRTIQMALRFSF